MNPQVVKPKTPTTKPLNAKQTSALWWRICKLSKSLEKLSRREPALCSLLGAMDVAQRELLKLEDERKLDEALKKDKGDVLWTIFHPLPLPRSVFDRQKVVTRTPHREIVEGAYFLDPREVVSVVCPDEAYSDLQREWPVPDPVVVATRTKEAIKQWARRDVA